MNEAYGDRLRAAFDELSSRPPAAREAFVRATYGDDPRLMADLLGMIGHLGSESSFLEPLPETDVRVLLGHATESSEWPGEALPELEGRVLAQRYAMGRRIGSGGASVVYEAHDRLHERPVAVKVLRREGRRSRRALRREVSALRLLRLPGVVQLLDEGVEGDLAFLVTERVDGTPFPGQSGAASWSDLADVTAALLEALDRMHRAGIVHGDLKPANVLVRKDGVPILLDLGIAEGPRAAAQDPRDAARRGTLRYMAPEQVGGARPTPRSDLYALGVMLHEALAGEPYRSVPTVALAKMGVVSEAPKPLSSNVPPAVQDAVQRLLQHDPARRPSSAAEALALLRAQHVTGMPEHAVPVAGVLALEDLRSFFAGPDRLLHLQEDGAVELWRRTHGAVERLAEELDAWGRAGLGYWEDGLFHLRRHDIEHLRRTAHSLAPVRSTVQARPSLSSSERALLAAIEVAGARATPRLLVGVLSIDLPSLTETVEGLVARGCVLQGAEGAFRLPEIPEEVATYLGTHGAALHGRVAARLPRGDEQRLRHWIEAGRLGRVPAESLALARACLADGDPGGARAAAETGLGSLEADARPEMIADLLEVHHVAALQQSTRRALDDHLHQLGRWPSSPRIELLERIARGLLQALDGQPQRALDGLPSADEAASEAGLRCLVSARLFAGRLCRGERFEAEIRAASALAADDPTGPIATAAKSAEAWRAYQQERYEEAGCLHAAVSLSAPYPTTRITALQSAAAAYLEAGHFDRAETLAREALDFARERRHAAGEARAEQLLRAAAYRRGDDLMPDAELARAAEEVGPPQLAGLIALTEAAIAWRRGDGGLAAGLAARAARLRPGSAGEWHRLLARALEAAASAPVAPEAAQALFAQCVACPSDAVAVQAAALLARADVGLAPEANRLCPLRAAAIPRERWAFRLEILSIAEALK